MAEISRIQTLTQPGTSPYGNVSALAYPIVTDASGVWIDGNSKAPIAAGDILKLGRLPSGFQVLKSEVQLFNSVGSNGQVTAGIPGMGTPTVGFLYCDGEDVLTSPQGVDALVKEQGTPDVSPGTLPKDAWLVLKAGGKVTGAGRMEIILTGINHGPAESMQGKTREAVDPLGPNVDPPNVNLK